MELDYLDYVFDCHKINELPNIPDGSLDVISITNVLHHLSDPLSFLIRAHCKLKQGGSIILLEPYFSKLSSVIFRVLHHEPVIFNTEHPLLEVRNGPLSSANMALPYSIFFIRKDWQERLTPYFDFSSGGVVFYSSLSYMATGGISRRIYLPPKLYEHLHYADNVVAQKFPKICASFFMLKLKKRA